jgi:hypothetical protein
MDTTTHVRALDILYRLLPIWYDSTWAFIMSPRGDTMLKRVNNHRRARSSSESVASSVADASLSGRSFEEKMQSARDHVGSIDTLLTYQDYKDLCACCLKTSDNLYPGFHDVLTLALDILKTDDRFVVKLTERELSKISIAMVYQCIYMHLCETLLGSTKGTEALKLLTLPTKLSHPAYDICRDKFCRLFVDDEDIVTRGLESLVKRILRHRRDSAPPPPAPQEQPSSDDEADKATIPPLIPRAAYVQATKRRTTAGPSFEVTSDISDDE